MKLRDSHPLQSNAEGVIGVQVGKIFLLPAGIDDVGKGLAAKRSI
jgi:hypothetical protein